MSPAAEPIARATSLLAAVLAWLLLGGAALAAPTFPPLTGRVVDQAGLLNAADEQALTEKLAALEAQTGAQVVVATLPDLQGYEIEEYGYQLGRAWGIGQKDVNNGALLIVAPNERKVRIEVGYGLEGTLTDALSSMIIQRAILPKFRDGDMAAGIRAGVDEMVAILSDPNVAEARKQEAAQRAAEEDGIPPELIFWVILILFFFVLPAIRAAAGGRRRRFGGLGAGLPPVIVWDWHDRGGRGGGWGGGGGGGWSGGGGTFGGGGSSGSW